MTVRNTISSKRRPAAKKPRKPKQPPMWQQGNVAYCLIWIMGLHGVSMTVAKKQWESTSPDIKREMLRVAKQKRAAGIAP